MKVGLSKAVTVKSVKNGYTLEMSTWGDGDCVESSEEVHTDQTELINRIISFYEER